MEPDDVLKILCRIISAVPKRQTNVSGVSGSKFRLVFFVYSGSQKRFDIVTDSVLHGRNDRLIKECNTVNSCRGLFRP